MTNPFEYYNKEYVYYEKKDNNKIPEIIMKYRLITSKQCHGCLKLKMSSYDINITNIYNSRSLQIPENFIDDECNIKDEYKFIIKDGITPDNLPDWFSIWTNYYNFQCHKNSQFQETYIPISFKVVLK